MESSDNIAVQILDYPCLSDWQRCKMLALATQGTESSKPPTKEWKIKMLRAEHSPIRTLRFLISMEIPYYSSVHFCRHKIGVEHYVRSQRTDRNPGKPDRDSLPQGATVTHIMEINAPELMQMARMRLCGKADPMTRRVMQEIRRKVIEVCPEMEEFLVPKCRYLKGCNEIHPCGAWDIPENICQDRSRQDSEAPDGR